jgi:hypothetical protein
MTKAERHLQALIDRRSPEVAATTRKALAVMRRRYPGAVQPVFENRNRLAVGFGTGEKGSQVVFSIVAYPRWVTLFFFQGPELDDPDGLLVGSGNQVRSVRLDAEATQLNDRRVKTLMAQAARIEGASMKKGDGRVVIRTVT